MGAYFPPASGGDVPDPLSVVDLFVTGPGATGVATIDNLSASNNVIATQESGRLGFYEAPPILQQTGVLVTAAGIHAALVNLGLITA